MSVLKKTTFIAVFVFLHGSMCGADDNVSQQQRSRQLRLPTQPYNYRISGFLAAEIASETHAADHRIARAYDNTPANNPITDHGATLGRVLFYDVKLSANGTTSCASCHQQEHAFSDPRKVSVGFAGAEVTRNSMSLINVRYYPSGKMFWDERAESLEQQVLMPIENPIEMGHSVSNLVAQLSQDPLYQPLFVNAFGDQRVTSDRIAKALAQFVRSIASFRSRYDQGRMNASSVLDPFPNFTDQENYGKQQFFERGRCANCHLEDFAEPAHEGTNDRSITHRQRQSAFFFVRKATVNGIDGEDAMDQGVAEHSRKEEDIGRFKVSSLRNIEVTGPYMHDGRFHTLDQVVEHYNWSVRPHPNLDQRLELATSGIALPEREKVALTKFLLTLTDQQILHDRRFSDPFVRDQKQAGVSD